MKKSHTHTHTHTFCLHLVKYSLSKTCVGTRAVKIKKITEAGSVMERYQKNKTGTFLSSGEQTRTLSEIKYGN